MPSVYSERHRHDQFLLESCIQIGKPIPKTPVSCRINSRAIYEVYPNPEQIRHTPQRQTPPAETESSPLHAFAYSLQCRHFLNRRQQEITNDHFAQILIKFARKKLLVSAEQFLNDLAPIDNFHRPAERTHVRIFRINFKRMTNRLEQICHRNRSIFY